MVNAAGETFRKLRLVFCGTPQFAVPTLGALIASGHEIALVVTQPDRLVGRKQILTAPPVKLTSMAHGLSVTQPEKIKNNLEFRAVLEGIAPDAIVVVAYGRIIPKWMLELPRLGCINLHGSLLPKYRGAAPVQWAIANGDSVLGNTTMLLEEGLDTGPMLLQQSMTLGPEKTAEDALAELAVLGAPLLVETLQGLAQGTIRPRPQEHMLATLAPILQREDGRIDFGRQTAVEIFNRWRGFQPWPGIYSAFKGKKLILNKVRLGLDDGGLREPGEVWAVGKRFGVGCAGGTSLELKEIQLEGKNRATAEEFFRGHAIEAGTRLGE